MEIVGKITVKEVCGKIDRIKLAKHQEEHPNETLWLAEIIGIANRLKPGATTMPDGKVSEWVKFFGNFVGTEMATGKVVHSGACMLPGSAPQLVANALVAGATAVDFGFRIGVVFDDSTAVGYRFKVETMIEVAENDPLKQLVDRIKGPKQPQITGPAIDIHAAEAARAASQQAPAAEANQGKGGKKAA